MTFQLARKKLDELAGKEYHSMRFDLTTYADGRTEPRCDMYIADVGWTTRDNATWEEALAELTSMMHKPETVSDLEIEEMTYGTDYFTAEDIVNREAQL